MSAPAVMIRIEVTLDAAGKVLYRAYWWRSGVAEGVVEGKDLATCLGQIETIVKAMTP